MLAAIAKTAARLCEANDATIFLVEGDQARLVATYGRLRMAWRLGEVRPLTLDLVAHRAIVERRTIHVRDLAKTPRTRFLASKASQLPLGVRTMLATPLLRDGAAIGTIIIRRTKVRPFTPKQIALLKTFAERAAIAVENARLSQALEARNADLTEALDQQTATSDILRVISSSPTDIRPVLETVVRAAARFCGAVNVAILRLDGGVLRGAATVGPFGDAMVARVGSPERIEVPLTRGSVTGRAVLERRTVHVHDLAAEPEDEFPVGRELQLQFGHRTLLAAPLLREGEPLGAIALFRTEVNPFSDKQLALLRTFADQAVIAIENVRLFTELEARNRDLTEALEQQTATSEILRVISSSPTDTQPILDAVAQRATRLCEAYDAMIALTEGERLRVRAHHGPIPIPWRADSRPLNRGWVSGRAVLDRRPVHVHDLAASEAEFPLGQADAVKAGHRTTLGVPLLREDEAIGVILIRRLEVRPFTDKQIALLKTFADQAVIAIENVRLFTELEARNSDLRVALEQQTATSEILRVISSSPTDEQPVFDGIVQSARRLCEATFSLVFLVEANQLSLAAVDGVDSGGIAALHGAYPRPVARDTTSGRAILDRRLVHIEDSWLDPEYTHPLRDTIALRSILTVPIFREGLPIGALSVWRGEVRPFTDKQIALLQTFADQAVIALENVRLFKELEARNRDLTVALEQQTATSEILRVISSSPTDVQPVFEAMAANALRLCDAKFSAVFRFDGTLIHLAALHNVNPEGTAAIRAAFPMPPGRGGATPRAILTRSIVHIPDVREDSEYVLSGLAKAADYRSFLSVPMLRDGRPIGAISVARTDARPFPNEQIELLKTFADQALIAIENVRLFKELQARTSELTQSVEKLTALGEVSQALSSTLDVETVLDTIVSHASQLAGGAGCAIYEYEEAAGQFELRATHGYDARFVEALRAAPLRRGEGLMGRAAEMREPIQVPDITQPGAYESSIRDTLIRFGYRALLSVPLLREEQIIGSLSLNRKAPGEFPPEVIEVLKTFATQSALAIQNARLFREIADKSRQLEVASRHKSEFLANMSHELRTPLNAIIGFSEVLNERMFGELNEKQDEYLKDIHASGQHLLSLINDILDLSKVEAGRMELELTDFDLPAAIDNALTLVRERAGRRGVTLRTAVGAEVGMIRGDERKIRQVLLNLLSNAIKFTPEGGRIEVGAAPADGAVEVSVSDTGVGIAPEDQEAVFEEFRQVGASAAKQEGTGLGLALCRKFIELHGGTIRVTSAVGAGSTFTFSLPK